MPEPSLHPPQSTLDLFVEGVLPAAEQSQVASHVAICQQCEAEAEACRAVIGMLGALPRLEPAAGFADAVMARVRVAPEAGSLRMPRWVPRTKRAWALVVGAAGALSAPAMAVLAWILAQPLVTFGGLWYMAATGFRQLAWNVVSQVSASALEHGFAGWLPDVIQTLVGLPASTLAVMAACAVLLVPLSGWSLIHLARPSTGRWTHAH